MLKGEAIFNKFQQVKVNIGGKIKNWLISLFWVLMISVFF